MARSARPPAASPLPTSFRSRLRPEQAHCLSERSRDLQAAARCVGRGLRRAGHGWPAAASQAWVSGDCSRGTAAQSLRTPGVLRRAGRAMPQCIGTKSTPTARVRRTPRVLREAGRVQQTLEMREVHRRNDVALRRGTPPQGGHDAPYPGRSRRQSRPCAMRSSK